MACLHPTGTIKTTFRDEAVDMGMEDHSLAPGVERGDDAGCCADMFFIEKEFVERSSHYRKEQVRHDLQIGEPQLIQLMRQREDHMVMTAGKQTLFLLLQPLPYANPVALRADSMTAGVVPLPMVITFGAGLNVTAERCSTTEHECTCGLAHMIRERMRLLIAFIRLSHNVLKGRSGHEAYR